MIKDMMRPFELYRPADLPAARELAERHGAVGWLLAGGNDSLDWFKDRVKSPEAVIDLGEVEELGQITEVDGGVEVGSMVTLTQLSQHSVILRDFALLAVAASHVASPQIRNTGTIGGNLCQDARCWYYRSGLPCFRAGGNKCYANTPEGMNREHCLFGASGCVAVSPSDLAPAMVALDAEMVILENGGGERVVAAEQFFVGPDVDITRMTVLQPGEILKSIRIPPTFAGARFHFEKVADRKAWDFALVNIASAMLERDGAIVDARVVCGAVECVPRRLSVVEEILREGGPREEVALMAGQGAIRNASPLNYNHFKIPLMENLVRRAVRGDA